MSAHADIHADLSASVRAYAEREGGLGRVRRVRDSENGFDRAAWPALGQLGWLGLLAPEAAGGSGLGVTEMAVVAREWGRALMPEPLIPVGVLAAGILRHAEAGAGGALLQGLVKGETLPAVAWQEHVGDIDPGRVEVEAIATADGVRVSGTKHFVVCGSSADGYLTSARADRGIALYWIPRASPGLAYRPMRRADGSEHGTLTLDRVAVSGAHTLLAPGSAVPVMVRAIDEALAVTGSELLGVAERALEMTLDYLRTRVQFGKPIGSFQALQHRCVDLFIAKELAVSALSAALPAMAAADAGRRSALASRVKSRCADAALDICRKAIQLHGAMGFTDECDIGLYLKRALTLSAWLGNAPLHRRRYASLALGEKLRPSHRTPGRRS